MSRVFNHVNPNLWLGTPRTAVNTVPVTAGLRMGDPTTGRGRVRLQGGQISNVTAGACGLGMLFADAQVVAGSWTNATTTFANDTTDAQDIDIDDFALFTTTASDGFIVGCSEPFNMLSIDQTTASSGGSPVFAYAYWGRPTTGLASASTGWQTVATNLITASWTAAAAERLVVVNVPVDLEVAVVSGDITGGAPLVGKYAIRVIATTAPSTAGGTAARIYAGRELHRTVSAGANTENNFGGGIGADARIIDGGVGLQSFYATAAASNHLYLEYI